MAAGGEASSLELDPDSEMSESDECMELDPDFEVKLACDEKPKKIIEYNEITKAADRLKLSDNQATMLVSVVIKASAGNLDGCEISRST